MFDQPFNSPLNDPTQKVWATKRDLTKVLDHHRCKEHGFNLHNTIMIDSDLLKVRDYPKNSIVIKPYEESEVRNPTEDQSKILLEVKDYIFEMLEQCNDVRTYLKDHRPSFQLWENGQLSASSRHEDDDEESKRSESASFSSFASKKEEEQSKATIASKDTAATSKDNSKAATEEIVKKLEEVKIE